MNKIKVDGQILVVPNGYNFVGYDRDGIAEFNSEVFQMPKRKTHKAYNPSTIKDSRILDYNSDNISDLPYGGVAQQIRENFKKVGDKGIVRANCYRTVVSTFHKFGYSVITERIPGKPNEIMCTRVPKVYKRVKV
jgi:hypothetical protein